MILDWAIYAAAIWGLVALLNRTVFANEPASRFVAWASTALIFVVNIVALSAMKYYRYDLISQDIGTPIRPTIPLDFAGAFTFSWMFFYLLRKRPKAVSKDIRHEPKLTHRFSWRRMNASRIGNEAYAEALQEIDEGRHDKGLWGRSLAESDGDEKKAKAAYIKGRARLIHESQSAPSVAPPSTDTGIGPAKPVAKSKWATQTMLAAVGVAVVGIVAAVVLPAYKDYTNRQKSPQVKPWEEYLEQPQANAKRSQIDEFLRDAPQQRPAEGQSATPQFVPFTGVLDPSAAEGPRSKFTPVKPVNNSAPIQSQDQQAYSISLEKAVAAIEREIDSAYNYQLLSMVTDIEIRYPVFRTEAGQVASRRLKAQIDEKMAGLARPAPRQRETQQQQTKLTPKQPAVPPAASIPESARTRAFNAQEQADLNAVAARALSDYPFLDTPDGQEVLNKIMRRRDELIKQGVYPSIALTRAVNDFAPAYAPVATRESPAAQSTESVRPESHTAFPPGCRWVTPKDWSCK